MGVPIHDSHDVLGGVFMLARELRRHIAEAMAQEQWALEAGFRPPCMGVVAVVQAMQPVSQRAISDKLGVDASDIAGVMQVLEEAGIVERRRDPSDRRRHAVVLTAAGERAAARFAAMRAEIEDKVLGRLDPHERQTLAALLHKAGVAEEPVGVSPAAPS